MTSAPAMTAVVGGWYERASHSTAGGVSAGGKYHGALRRAPYLTHARGSRLWDVDGNEFIDYSGASGAALLGHGHPAVVAAVTRAFERGLVATYETPDNVELCERICEIIPAADAVRLVNTGTEATLAAVRLARAATGRSMVLRFDGHFHGFQDVLMMGGGGRTGPGRFAAPSTPDGPGIPQAHAALVVTAPFNDRAALDAALDAHGDDVACVILEPVSYNQGCIPADPDWLRHLRNETARRGAVLIFDEVLSGFRTGLGGAQEHYGVTPDLCTLGKALGGGWPIAALAGRRDLMDHLDPAGPVRLSGTYSGHLPAVRAALAALDVMAEPGFYPRLLTRCETFYAGLRALLDETGLPARLQAVGARFALYLGTSQPVRDHLGARQHRPELAERFCLEAWRQGLYFHLSTRRAVPMHYGVSAAHTGQDLHHTLEVLRQVFASVAAAAQPSTPRTAAGER
jgi:glutamate-1-semialdehyde 2,1-aminomutase